MAQKKNKKMTAAEKKLRAESKKWLQEEGILPPDKKPLNRRRFIAETQRLWKEREQSFIWDQYSFMAISYLIGKRERSNRSPSLEAVGVAKVLRIALKLHEFHEKAKDEGKTGYTVGEQYDYIKDIIDR